MRMVECTRDSVSSSKWSSLCERPVLLVDFASGAGTGSSPEDGRHGRGSAESYQEAGEPEVAPSYEQGMVDCLGSSWMDVKKKCKSSSKFLGIRGNMASRGASESNRSSQARRHESVAAVSEVLDARPNMTALSPQHASDGSQLNTVPGKEGSSPDSNIFYPSPATEASCACDTLGTGLLDAAGVDKSQRESRQSSSIPSKGLGNGIPQFRWGDLDEEDLKTTHSDVENGVTQTVAKAAFGCEDNHVVATSSNSSFEHAGRVVELAELNVTSMTGEIVQRSNSVDLQHRQTVPGEESISSFDQLQGFEEGVGTSWDNRSSTWGRKSYTHPGILAEDVSDTVPLHSSAVGVVYLEDKVGDSTQNPENEMDETLQGKDSQLVGIYARMDSRKLLSVDDSRSQLKFRSPASGSEHMVSHSSTSAAEVPLMDNKVSSVPATDRQDEVVESKERFRQRLWCFLFENLNRVIDELYFMCEVEFDTEQMDEVLLVLADAGIDFRELKARAETFENVQSGVPQNSGAGHNARFLRGEHQRPHAIAWEVRRMASSPRWADILSSSLDAFKKVQSDKPHQGVEIRGKRRDAARFLTYNRGAPLPEQGKPLEVVVTDKRKVAVQSENTATDVCKGKEDGHPQDGESQSEVSVPGLPSVRGGQHSETCIHVKGVEAADHPAVVTARSKSERYYDSTSNPLDLPAGTVCSTGRERRVGGNKSAIQAWKEQRNWEDILTSPLRSSSRPSRSPSTGRKSARELHDKLMSPEKKKKSPLEMKRQVDEKQARATKLRLELENERVMRLQRTTEKLNRVTEWQAVRSSRLREGMHARQQRGESRHEAHLAQIARRASDESSKVSEVRFITSLNEENRKLSLQQKLQDSELRRAERLQNIRIKQKDLAKEEAALERRKLLEAERLQRIADAQRKKVEANLRREEERRAASAAREARAVEQVRKKEVRAKAQEEETMLLGQRLAERLRESSARRKVYLEQIRERAGTEPDKSDKRRDFQNDSPSRKPRDAFARPASGGDRLLRVASGPATETDTAERDAGSLGRFKAVTNSLLINTGSDASNMSSQQALKKRVKRLRQRLAAHKFEFVEPPTSPEGAGVGLNSVTSIARSKIGRLLQDLQRSPHARKAGVPVSVIGDVVKYLDGKEAELHAARQAALLDYVATALPASQSSKPETSRSTIALLHLLLVLLSLPVNRSYFIARNLLPPLVPMLSTALENFCSLGSATAVVTSYVASKESCVERTLVEEKLEVVGEVLEGLLLSITAVMGHCCTDDRLLVMQDDLAELIVGCEVLHRLCNLFALFDRPLAEGAPIPVTVLLGLKLLETLTGHRDRSSSVEAPVTCMVNIGDRVSTRSADQAVQVTKAVTLSESGNGAAVKEHDGAIGDVCTSLSAPDEACGYAFDTAGELGDLGDLQLENVTSVPVISKNEMMTEHMSSWNTSKTLSVQPSLFSGNSLSMVRENTSQHRPTTGSRSKELLLSVALETGLIGLPSLLTAVLLQANPRSSPEQAAAALPSNFDAVATSVLRILNNLARLDLFLVQNMLALPDLRMEFFHLISFLLSHCTCKWKNTTDQVASLLLETLLLVGYFALLHPENQAVLRWGKSPTILHKICDLPFTFFSDRQLTPILNGTLLAACFGCDRNRDVVQQELSMKSLVSFLRTAKEGVANTFKNDTEGGRHSKSDILGRSVQGAGKDDEVDAWNRSGTFEGLFCDMEGKSSDAETIGLDVDVGCHNKSRKNVLRTKSRLQNDTEAEKSSKFEIVGQTSNRDEEEVGKVYGLDGALQDSGAGEGSLCDVEAKSSNAEKTGLDMDVGSQSKGSKKLPRTKSSWYRQTAESGGSPRKPLMRNVCKPGYQSADLDSTLGRARDSHLSRTSSKGSISSPGSDALENCRKARGLPSMASDGFSRFAELYTAGSSRLAQPGELSAALVQPNFFRLESRFPKGLWKQAEEFFSVEVS